MQEAANVDWQWHKKTTQNYELAEECLKINYYGAKRMVEEFIPLLQLSDSPRIVNVSSSLGILKVKSYPILLQAHLSQNTPSQV